MKSKQKNSILDKADSLRWEVGENFHDSVMESIYSEAARISDSALEFSDKKRKFDWNVTLDKLLTSRIFGYPLMILMLAVVFWITITGANIPSGYLSWLLIDILHTKLQDFAAWINMPFWISGFLFDGVYLAGAWVVSVMLPPMAIFFPLFTLLEDFGYLPRVAFNLDNLFRKVGAHGRQALTMVMGYGCNAAGIVSTRIIDSPRERLIAIITNNFSLCNGRWPAQILIATIFIGASVPAYLAGIVSAASVVIISLLGVFFMFAVSFGLSRTILKGEASSFSLELPPYRPPNILQTLYKSLIDRTAIVLWRAVVFAFPAGGVIWLISNISISGKSLAVYIIDFLDPMGIMLGLNGIILLAYIIAIPANEIVIPTVLMLTVLTTGITGTGSGAGVLFELDNAGDTALLLHTGGWTIITGINLMLFSLLHNPCSTTIYTIYKETGSIKWTAIATLLPVIIGLLVCFITALLWKLFH